MLGTKSCTAYVFAKKLFTRIDSRVCFVLSTGPLVEEVSLFIRIFPVVYPLPFLKEGSAEDPVFSAQLFFFRVFKDRSGVCVLP